MGHSPTDLPSIDALGRCNHVWVDTTGLPGDGVPTLVDLFAGAGGVGLGFERAGFRSLLAVECDEDAAATYQLNFPFCDLVLRDIRDIPDNEVLFRLDGTAVDVIFAGWPCQGISPAGLQDPTDPRNVLYREAVRFVDLLRPHLVVLENVPALLDAPRRWLVEELVALLDDVGYPDASVVRLDAVNYGVPQHRERVLTIANRHGWNNPYPRPLPGGHETARDALDDLLGRPQSRWFHHVHARHDGENVEDMDRMRAGGRSNRRTTLARRLLDPDLPSPTALYCQGTRFVHYGESRMLTPREYARLQGFPDDHLFDGPLGSVGVQVCNAVPPPLAEHVALAVRTVLDAVGDGKGRPDGRIEKRSTAGGVASRFPRKLEPVDANCHLPHPGLPVNHVIEGDNLEVMTALRETHAGRIDAIFADPPYNTGKSESYRNSFDRDEWLRDLSERMTVARDLLTPDGVICMAIDHFELFALGSSLDTVFDRSNRLAVVSVVHNQKGRSGFDHDRFSEVNEYYLFYARDARHARINPVAVSEEELGTRFPHRDEEGLFTWHSLVRGGGRSRPYECPDQHYPIHANPDTGEMALHPFDGSIEVLPFDSEGEPRVWRCIPATLEDWARRGLLRVVPASYHPSGHQIQMKTRANSDGGRAHVLQPKTVWSDPTFNATAHGTRLLRRMIGPNPFSYPKSVFAVREALRAMVGHRPEAIVLDPYAGSGTTGHAVLMMNAEDGGRRSFILVNSDEVIYRRGFPATPICEGICLPRMRAAIDGYGYTERGRVRRVEGLPGNVRYLRAKERTRQDAMAMGPSDETDVQGEPEAVMGLSRV